MICYQDEKTYGGKTDMTLEEIDCEIEKLEMELYGRTFLNDSEKKIERKPMITILTGISWLSDRK